MRCSSWKGIMRKLTSGFIFCVFLAETFRLGIALGGPIDDLKPGEWYEVPNSHLRAVTPTEMYADFEIGRFSSIIDAWNSGAYDTKRDRYIITGGGHNDYGGNELYAFDINTLSWSRIWGPSPGISSPGPGGETYSDGNPVSRHTYDGLEYLSNMDRFWMHGGSKYNITGSPSQATWLFDFDSLQWERKSDISYRSGLEMVSAYDPVTNKVFVAGKGSNQTLIAYDPVSDSWTERGDLSIDVAQTAAIDPVRRTFVSLGSGKLFAYDLQQTGTISRQDLSTTGDTSMVSIAYPGIVYDPVSDKMVAWNGGVDVYLLDLDTLVWTRVTPAPTNTVIPTPAPHQGTFGRWQYIPSKNAFIVVNSIDENVWIYKLSQGGTPPDATPPSVPTNLQIK